MSDLEGVLRNMLASINEGLPKDKRLRILKGYKTWIIYDSTTTQTVSSEKSEDEMYQFLLGFAAGIERVK